MTKEEPRKIVIPGEVIFEGDDYLPGEGTSKEGNKIIALRYGLAEEQNRLVKVIALSGVYIPRRGNVVIGEVVNLTYNGWLIDFGSSITGFLGVAEVPKYVNQDDLESVLDIGDMVVAKVSRVSRRGVDVSIKFRGLGKIDEGLIMNVDPHKVPRVIGKEGSMINLIKDHTNCQITVGQNGFISVKGDKVEDELLAKEAILFVTKNTTINGLTDKLKDWFEKQGGKK